MKQSLWIIGVLILIVGSVSAQDAAPIDPRLQEQLDQIEANTEVIRELTAQSDITVDFPTRDDLRQYLLTLFEEEYDAETAALDRAFYVAFDFIEPDLNLRDELFSFYQEQIGGFYDTDTQIMNVILLSGREPGRFLPFLERIVYAHEYVHALQDQYFDLDALLEGIDPEENGDQALATLALIEGDASHVMNTYTVLVAEANPIGTLLQLGQGITSSPQSLTIPETTPDIVANELLWPYTAGEIWVRFLRQEGGWEAVNAAYSNPPVSSEQIMQPERYLAGDMPQTVTVTSNLDLLGAGWSEARQGVMGMFHLDQYLSTQLESDLAFNASAGWGGSRYIIYENDSGAFAWELSLVWDSAEEGFEFADAYGQFAQARFDANATVALDNRFCWEREADAICALFDGSTSRLTQAPTLAQAGLLLDN